MILYFMQNVSTCKERQAAACVKSIMHNMSAIPFTSTLFICDAVNIVCHIFLQLYALLVFTSSFLKSSNHCGYAHGQGNFLCVL